MRLPKGAEAQCVSCQRVFTSDSAFDGHLAPLNASEPCYDPAALVRKNRAGHGLGPKFQLVQRAGGPTWALATDEAQQARWAS